MITDLKITTTNKDIASLADKPQLTPAQLKARFDLLAKELVTNFNSLIDTLTGEDGASNIGVGAGDIETALGGAAKRLVRRVKREFYRRRVSVSGDVGRMDGSAEHVDLSGANGLDC